ncbi:hypothetical protein [Bradyrhizobium elkanii]
MKRQTKGDLHAWLHGQAKSDGGLPQKTSAGAVPPHDQVNHSYGQPRTLKPSDWGSKHFRSAAELGRSGHNHVGHVAIGTLPASPRGAQSQIMTKTDRRR